MQQVKIVSTNSINVNYDSKSTIKYKRNKKKGKLNKKLKHINDKMRDMCTLYLEKNPHKRIKAFK